VAPFRRGKNDRLAAVVLISGVISAPCLAQERLPDPEVGPKSRTVSLVAGLGNSVGGFGASIEKYFAQTRLSAFVGLGYIPEVDDYPSGVAGAVGIRGYTGGRKHRGFAELSVSPIAVERFWSRRERDGAFLYGPSVQAGYQLLTTGGFTFLISAGVGYVLGVSAQSAATQAVGGLGFGYTWQRY